MAKVFAPDAPLPTRPLSGPGSYGTELQHPKWVVKNMYRFAQDAEQALDGIAALRNMVEGTEAEDLEAVVEACGVEAIIAAMQRHPDSAPVQILGCGALSVIARGSVAARSRVHDAGGLLEAAAAVERCRAIAEGDGEAVGGEVGDEVAARWEFCAQCLREVAGKRSDPRNRSHMDDAIARGVDSSLFGR